ncbi:MAG: CbiX/SirB N-terminal domain-containing protein [Candidatus Hydrogenedentes bacterium]|nr:CbiX/SirB N-terminal domain-containing protein [Candidatus Hydrogenedentota bacterium]
MIPITPDTAIVLVDHGSTHAAANDMLVEVARMLRDALGGGMVEPAHMELAEPTIEQTFAECVARGARRIVVHPYFLAPGRHSTQDIPRMCAEAAAKFPGVTHTVTEPLGLDTRMIDVVRRRIQEAVEGEVSAR